jgi:hypothetical protein
MLSYDQVLCKHCGEDISLHEDAVYISRVNTCKQLYFCISCWESIAGKEYMPEKPETNKQTSKCLTCENKAENGCLCKPCQKMFYENQQHQYYQDQYKAAAAYYCQCYYCGNGFASNSSLEDACPSCKKQQNANWKKIK